MTGPGQGAPASGGEHARSQAETASMERTAILDCGCVVESRIREQHVYGETNDIWCTRHATWHTAEHHEFAGSGEECGSCQNAARWHADRSHRGAVTPG